MEKEGTGSDSTTGGVEVHVDGFRRILRLEEEELGNDDVGSVVRDRSIDANDSLLKQTRENVVGALPAGRVLNHHWNQTVKSKRV